jgi:putative NADH-flavin reductase
LNLLVNKKSVKSVLKSAKSVFLFLHSKTNEFVIQKKRLLFNKTCRSNDFAISIFELNKIKGTRIWQIPKRIKRFFLNLLVNKKSVKSVLKSAKSVFLFLHSKTNEFVIQKKRLLFNKTCRSNDFAISIFELNKIKTTR